MFEDIGVVAGMEGVAITEHGRMVTGTGRPGAIRLAATAVAGRLCSGAGIDFEGTVASMPAFDHVTLLDEAHAWSRETSGRWHQANLFDPVESAPWRRGAQACGTSGIEPAGDWLSIRKAAASRFLTQNQAVATVE